MVFIESILTKLVKEVKMFEFEFEFEGMITNRLIRVTSLVHHDLLVGLLLDSSSCVSWLFAPSRAGPAYGAGLVQVDPLHIFRSINYDERRDNGEPVLPSSTTTVARQIHVLGDQNADKLEAV
ncbi:hypothetical protein F5883DRAFT_639974 [Diaporthe sp. PMI_573]|nr:hypothetical protein F5883DRAFT_639974 [Diaporthaceae sp. PMI_573]